MLPSFTLLAIVGEAQLSRNKASAVLFYVLCNKRKCHRLASCSLRFGVQRPPHRHSQLWVLRDLRSLQWERWLSSVDMISTALSHLASKNAAAAVEVSCCCVRLCDIISFIPSGCRMATCYRASCQMLKSLLIAFSSHCVNGTHTAA